MPENMQDVFERKRGESCYDERALLVSLRHQRSGIHSGSLGLLFGLRMSQNVRRGKKYFSRMAAEGTFH